MLEIIPAVGAILTIILIILAAIELYLKYFYGPKLITEFINCSKTRDRPDTKYCIFFDIINKGNQAGYLNKIFTEYNMNLDWNIHSFFDKHGNNIVFPLKINPKERQRIEYAYIVKKPYLNIPPKFKQKVKIETSELKSFKTIKKIRTGVTLNKDGNKI